MDSYAPDKELPKKREDSDIAREIIDLEKRLSAEKATLDSHCQEIADRVWPAHSKGFTTTNHGAEKGDKRNTLVLDSTASIALGRFGSILDSLLTPRNQTYHRVMASDPQLNKSRQVQLYFDDVTRMIFKYRYAPKANFSSQNQLVFKSLGAFGTGPMFTDQLAKAPGLRYRQVHLGQIRVRENHQGVIDTVVRRFPMTARQMVQKWGERVPAAIREQMKTTADREYEVIHCVKPNSEQDYGRLDFRGMPWSSHYVSIEGAALLSTGGYTTFPYQVPRYEQAPGEPYGRGPAMDVLPAIKTLNEQKKTLLKQGHRSVDPVMLIHDDGIIDTASLKPGAMIAGGVSADGRPLVHTLPVGRIDVGHDMMNDERAAINDAFLVTLFQILVESPQMTATEVLERTREKGILLAPTIGRQQSEYLGPLIEREVDILEKQGLLPIMPGILREAGVEYRIEYDSPLSRAQRAEEAAGLMRTVELALKIALEAQNPEPLDHFNWDVVVPEVASIQGVPVKWMRSIEEIMSMRQGREEQAQAQQAIQAAPGMAAMTKANAVAQGRA